jgi:hypothetical protein
MSLPPAHWSFYINAWRGNTTKLAQTRLRSAVHVCSNSVLERSDRSLVASRNERELAVNNMATLALALMGMGAFDAFLVTDRPSPGPQSSGSDTVYLAELPPGIAYNPAIADASPERARRLFAAWGEWRPGRVASRQFVIYDTSVPATRIFPTPEWLVSAGR